MAADEFTLDDVQAFLQRDTRGSDHLARLHEYADGVRILAITMDAEGRGESILGRVGIAWTVVNRQLVYGPDRGKSIAEVCLRRKQYSCWQKVDGPENYARTLAMAASYVKQAESPLTPSELLRFNESEYLAVGVVQRKILDPTRGATHYMRSDLYYGRARPTWAQPPAEVAAAIGAHVFLKRVA